MHRFVSGVADQGLDALAPDDYIGSHTEDCQFGQKQSSEEGTQKGGTKISSWP